MVLEGHGYEICLRTCTDVSPDNRDNKDASRTIRTGFMGKFVVSHDTLEVTERFFLMDESLHKGHLACLFCSYNFCISMIQKLFECLRIYFAGFFFQNRKFGEYLCKMPPKKRFKRRGSHEAERMSTRARSPEVDELSCVLETQQS